MYLKCTKAKILHIFILIFVLKGKIMEKDKHLGLRIDSDTHKKLKSLAEFEGRSINGEILYLIRQAITRHEKKHGSLL